MSEEQQLRYSNYFLSMVILSWILLESIELLKGTNRYRGSFKGKVNMLLPELERCAKEELPVALGTNDHQVYKMMHNTERLVARLGGGDQGLISLLCDCLDRYDADPAAFIKLNNIQVEESNVA